MVLQKSLKKSVSIADKVSSLNVVEGSINSPLHRFVRAKKRINQTFDEILEYLKESRQFLIDCDISDQYDFEAKQELEKVFLEDYFFWIFIYFILIEFTTFSTTYLFYFGRPPGRTTFLTWFFQFFLSIMIVFNSATFITPVSCRRTSM